jgi:hypothetical protein
MKAVGLGVISGLSGLAIMLFAGPEAWSGQPTIYLVLYGTVWGVLFGMFKWGLVRGEIAETVSPNQGIHQAIKYTLMLGLGAAVLGGTLGGLLVPQFMPIPAPLGMLLGAQAALGYVFAKTGSGVFKHYLLRFTWSRFGCMPLKYADLLDYAAERVFLRKVGGGYIFIHRLLQDYFASLETESRVDGQKVRPRDDQEAKR